MRILAFSSRNRKEIMRDPLSAIFGIGFPVILILLISLMKNSIKDMPSDLFAIKNFAPGMAVFGLSFISLFLGILMTNDYSSSFLIRLFTSPLTSFEFIMGYSLPFLPVIITQAVICFCTAAFFGLQLSFNILLAIVVLIPVGFLFIAFGLLMGSMLKNSQQVGGIGSILVNVAAWLSGIWFPMDMIGGVFKTVCEILPFLHAVNAVQAAVKGEYGLILPELLWVVGYTVIIYAAAVLLFKRKMKG